MVYRAPVPHDVGMNDITTPDPAPPTDPTPGSTPVELVRPRDDRMIAGVASGIARRLGIEAWVVRTAFVALAVAGGGGIALYLLGWIAIRDETESRSHAQRWFGSTRGDRRPDAQEA